MSYRRNRKINKVELLERLMQQPRDHIEQMTAAPPGLLHSELREHTLRYIERKRLELTDYAFRVKFAAYLKHH